MLVKPNEATAAKLSGDSGGSKSANFNSVDIFSVHVCSFFKHRTHVMGQRMFSADAVPMVGHEPI